MRAESDSERLAEVRRQIRSIKEAVHPVVRMASPDWPPVHEFAHRSWASVPESGKLSMLQDMVDWQGVTNRDMAHILLGELDVGKLSSGQRDMLIRLAAHEQQGMTSLAGLKCRHQQPAAQKTLDRSIER